MAPSYDFYIAFSVRATGSEERPVQECEITELSWAAVDATTGAAQPAQTVAVSTRSGGGPGVPLQQALAGVDQELDADYAAAGHSYVLVTDGPFPLRRALKLECAGKGIRLAPHWSLYFDLRKEAMRLRQERASTFTSLRAVVDAFGVACPDGSEGSGGDCRAIASVLRAMHAQGTPPAQRPQQIPYGDAASLERQWRSSPVSKDHIQSQQQHAQQKAAQVCGFGDESVGQRLCVRMRGLPFQATPADVKKFFQGLEIAEDGIQFLYNLQGKSKGEAFVQFPDEETAAAAAGRDKQFMADRYIEVFSATLQDMRYCLAQSNPSTAGSTIVRCRGMPYNAAPEDITSFFEGCKVVERGVSLCVGGDGRPTGEAFVQFATEEDTSRALRRHRCHLGGRYVEIFRSSKQEMVNQCQQRLRALGHKRGAARPSSPSQFSPHVVRLRGLPFSLNEMDVAALFAGLRITHHGIHMVYSAEEKPTGEAFVELETAEDVDSAVAKHKSPMGHRYVEVFRSSPDEIMLAACGDAEVERELPEQQQQQQQPQQLVIQQQPQLAQVLPSAAPGVVHCSVRRVITVTGPGAQSVSPFPADRIVTGSPSMASPAYAVLNGSVNGITPAPFYEPCQAPAPKVVYQTVAAPHMEPQCYAPQMYAVHTPQPQPFYGEPW